MFNYQRVTVTCNYEYHVSVIYQHHGELLRAVLPDDAGITMYHQVVSSCKLVIQPDFCQKFIGASLESKLSLVTIVLKPFQLSIVSVVFRNHPCHQIGNTQNLGSFFVFPVLSLPLRHRAISRSLPSNKIQCHWEFRQPHEESHRKGMTKERSERPTLQQHFRDL